MAQHDEADYLRSRKRRSEEMARTATDPGIARIHREFPDYYAAKLERHEGSGPPSA